MNPMAVLPKEIFQIILFYSDIDLFSIYKLVNKNWKECINNILLPFHYKDEIYTCIKNDYFSLFLWLINKHKLSINDRHIYKASFYGRLNFVKWFNKEGYSFNNDTIRMAIKGGHLNVLQYLESKHIPYTEQDFISAVSSERIEIIQWLIERNCPYNKDKYHTYTKNLEVLKYLSNILGINYIKLMTDFILRNNIEGIKAFYDINQDNTKLVNKCIEINNHELLHWLLINGCKTNTKQLQLARRKNNLKIVNLLENYA